MKNSEFLGNTLCAARPDPYYPHTVPNAEHAIAIIPPKKAQTNKKTQHNSVKICLMYRQVKRYGKKLGQKITWEVLKHHPGKYWLNWKAVLVLYFLGFFLTEPIQKRKERLLERLEGKGLEPGT